MPKYLTENIEFYKIMTSAYNQLQKTRIASENRAKKLLKEEDKVIEEMIQKIKKNEVDYRSMIKKMLEKEIIWTNFLRHISGIGETIAMKLLSFPLDLEKNITNWWSYAGLVPYVYKCQCEKGHKILSPKEIVLCDYKDFSHENKCNAKIVSCQIGETRRYNGYKSFWNPKLKTLAFIVSDLFIKQGKYYRKVFDFYKKRELEKGITKSHAHMRAKRLAFKIFLSHLHQAGCELLGVPYRKPYQFEFLNHKSFVDWKVVVDIEIKLK